MVQRRKGQGVPEKEAIGQEREWLRDRLGRASISSGCLSKTIPIQDNSFPKQYLKDMDQGPA